MSHHLDVLEGAGLITTRRVGRYKFHHLDVPAEFARLERLGVRFTQEPAEMGPVFDDTCGNLIQIQQHK